MPEKPDPQYQLCTYATASALAQKLNNIGVPVGDIWEIDENGVKTNTNSDTWFDNRQRHQYVATIWGPVEQNLGITDAHFKQNGYTVESFTQLANTSNVANPADAVLKLNGVVEAANRALEYGMR